MKNRGLLESISPYASRLSSLLDSHPELMILKTHVIADSP